MWLSQGGPTSQKHKGWSHPIATFLVHYSVVAATTIFFHDALRAMWQKKMYFECKRASSIVEIRQNVVGNFLFGYFCLYFLWRLALSSKLQNQYLLFPEFYRQTFLCSGTIFNASFGLYTARPVIAQAFCIAVGIDQMLWYDSRFSYS